MKGRHTHLEVTAYHEAGHVLAALKVGQYVEDVSIDRRNPGNGLTWRRSPRRNPYTLSINPELAWRHTFRATVDEMFISLAGPIAEAKLLGKPIRDLGSYSDYTTCLVSGLRLLHLAEFARDYTNIPPIDLEQLLSSTRDNTKRWIGRAKIWPLVESIAKGLLLSGHINGQDLAFSMGSALGAHQLYLQREKPSTFAALRWYSLSG